jgi:hypothetical protein
MVKTELENAFNTLNIIIYILFNKFHNISMKMYSASFKQKPRNLKYTVKVWH